MLCLDGVKRADREAGRKVRIERQQRRVRHVCCELDVNARLRPRAARDDSLER